MTITLTFGTWMIPFVVTIISFILFLIACWNDDNYNFSSAIAFIVAWATTFLLEEDYWGVISVIAIFAGLAASISSWIVWGLMLLLK